MTSTDLHVDPDELRQVAGVLDGAGSSVFDVAPDLNQSPDAGASSGEVARALADLSAAVAGLGQHLGTLAASTQLTGADFAATDQGVSGAMQQRQGALGP